MMNQPTGNNISALSSCEHLEYADYFEFNREQLYFVLHPTIHPPRARVLLAGPFATERPHRYISWVRWARYLASRGYEVMRFDYRGVGESTGRFEDYGLHSWSDDLLFCADWLKQRAPQVPLVMHGLGMGALLGQNLFARGTGDILLSWLPPKSARDMLYDQLRLKMSNNFSLPSSEHKTRDQFIAELENGGIVEVEGHNWTPRLWSEAAEFVFSEISISGMPSEMSHRYMHVGELDPLATHTFGGVGPNPLRVPGGAKPMRLVNPDLTLCFENTTGWLDNTLAGIGVS